MIYSIYCPQEFSPHLPGSPQALLLIPYSAFPERLGIEIRSNFARKTTAVRVPHARIPLQASSERRRNNKFVNMRKSFNAPAYKRSLICLMCLTEV